MVYIFCDNTAVVKVLSKEKPMDPRMLELLREFLYIVCTRRFTPFTPEFRKIGTSDNYIADFISRCHDHTKICNYFLPGHFQSEVEKGVEHGSLLFVL